MNRGLWHCTGDRNQDHPQEKEMHKGKMDLWGGLTNSCEKKRGERQRRKGSEVKSLNHVRLLVTPWTIAHQAPLSMGFSRQEYWSGLPFPSPREKERYTHLNAEFQNIARRDKKAFLSDQCKEIEENNRMGKTCDLFKKIRDTKETFNAKMGSIKDRNGMDLTEAEDIKKRWQEYRKTVQRWSSPSR